jgi:hypothetical protein
MGSLFVCLNHKGTKTKRSTKQYFNNAHILVLTFFFIARPSIIFPQTILFSLYLYHLSKKVYEKISGAEHLSHFNWLYQ